MAAPRPLPPDPVENTAVEGRKRNRRHNENEKAGEATTSTSVSSCTDGLSQQAQVSGIMHPMFTLFTDTLQDILLISFIIVSSDNVFFRIVLYLPEREGG